MSESRANEVKVKELVEMLCALDAHLDGTIHEHDWATLLMQVKNATLRDGTARRDLARAIGRFDGIHSIKARAERTTLEPVPCYGRQGVVHDAHEYEVTGGGQGKRLRYCPGRTEENRVRETTPWEYDPNDNVGGPT